VLKHLSCYVSIWTPTKICAALAVLLEALCETSFTEPELTLDDKDTRLALKFVGVTKLVLGLSNVEEVFRVALKIGDHLNLILHSF